MMEPYKAMSPGAIFWYLGAIKIASISNQVAQRIDP